MRESFRHKLLLTTMAATPFLLAACGDNTNTGGGGKFEIVVLPALLCTVSLAHDWLRKRSAKNKLVAAGV
jgi:hypothetical protein